MDFDWGEPMARKRVPRRKRTAQPKPAAKAFKKAAAASNTRKRAATEISDEPLQKQILAAAPDQHAREFNKKQAHDAVIIGSVCSGLATEKWAMDDIGVPCVHKFACDSNEHMKKFVAEQHKDDVLKFFGDIQSRDFRAGAGRVQVLVGGFPCQPFSAQGLGLGSGDERGTIIADIANYIRRHQPELFLLENVPGLLSRHAETFEQILLMLRGIKTGKDRACYYARCKSRNQRVGTARNQITTVGTRATYLCRLEYCATQL